MFVDRYSFFPKDSQSSLEIDKSETVTFRVIISMMTGKDAFPSGGTKEDGP